jgi:hypothetical protein
LRNALILKFSLLKALWSYTCSKFWKSYTPPAAWIRVNAAISYKQALNPVAGAQKCYLGIRRLKLKLDLNPLSGTIKLIPEFVDWLEICPKSGGMFFKGPKMW